MIALKRRKIIDSTKKKDEEGKREDEIKKNATPAKSLSKPSSPHDTDFGKQSSHKAHHAPPEQSHRKHHAQFGHNLEVTLAHL